MRDYLAGLGAVVTGIVPKMAIRFAAFERYKAWLTPETGKASSPAIFLGRLDCMLCLRHHLIGNRPFSTSRKQPALAQV